MGHSGVAGVAAGGAGGNREEPPGPGDRRGGDPRSLTVFDRSIFDTVRDFLHDEALSGRVLTLQRHLKLDL